MENETNNNPGNGNLQQGAVIISFSSMTKEDALKYCYKHQHKFKRDMEDCGENEQRQFDCLIAILDSGTIQPKDLPSYGMEY